MKQLEVYRVSRALFKCWAELKPSECQMVDEDDYIVILSPLSNLSVNIYLLGSNEWNDIGTAISLIASEKGIIIDDDTKDEDEWWSISITNGPHTYRGEYNGQIPFRGLALLDVYVHYLSNQTEI